MSLPIWTVDSFTTKPYKGNPAGVCLLKENQDLSNESYLTIAREMRHSETCFVVPRAGQSNHFNLRWFTPTVEVSLCGHGTLAASHVIFANLSDKLNQDDDLHFHTLSGELIVRREVSDGRLRMDFPKGNPVAVTLEPTILASLLHCLGLSSLDLSIIADTQFCDKTKKLFLEFKSSKFIFDAKAPDPEKLLAVAFPDSICVRGLCIVASSLEPDSNHPELAGCDIASRYFSPWNGLTEDPVNGSSHTALGVMYSRKLGKNEIKCYAASDRTGTLWLETPAESARIFIKGYATSVLSGEIMLPQ